MSFSWDSRPRPYGDSGQVDMGAIFNDPRFAETVQASVRQVATMSGAFAHSSIDPRALSPLRGAIAAETVAPVPLVASAGGLPGASDRYEGQRIDLLATPTGPVWQLTWREALNGGAGAWASSGAPIEQRNSGLLSTASTSWVDLGGMVPALVLPATGLYLWSFGAQLRNSGAAGSWSYMRPDRVPETDGSGIREQIDTTSRIYEVSKQYGAPVLSAAGTVVLRGKVTAGTADWIESWMSATPTELRP